MWWSLFENRHWLTQQLGDWDDTEADLVASCPQDPADALHRFVDRLKLHQVAYVPHMVRRPSCVRRSALASLSIARSEGDSRYQSLRDNPQTSNRPY